MPYFMRFGPVGHEIPAVVVDGNAYDLRSLTNDIDETFLASDKFGRAAQLAASGQLDLLDTTGLRTGSPIARPGAIICVGQNYAAHAAESGDLPPERPVIFFKHPNTMVGPFDEVEIPRGSIKTDWEVELGVVIGRRAAYLDSVESAMSHVAGLVISNDVSERAFQIEHSGGQWSKGKSCATFNPTGPWLVPLSEIPNVQNLRLQSRVNGEARQDSSTRDMVFAVAEIIYDLSQYMVLEPGDLINTGTPEGVAVSGRFPYLAAGDVMELEISHLGRQRQVLR